MEPPEKQSTDASMLAEAGAPTRDSAKDRILDRNPPFSSSFSVSGSVKPAASSDSDSSERTGEKDKGESQDYKGQYENIHSSPPREM